MRVWGKDKRGRARRGEKDSEESERRARARIKPDEGYRTSDARSEGGRSTRNYGRERFVKTARDLCCRRRGRKARSLLKIPAGFNWKYCNNTDTTPRVCSPDRSKVFYT